jgi:AraC-like DNA-binding protein
VVGAGEQLANAMAAPMAAGGPRAAANFLVHALTGKSSHGSDGAPPVHPQLRHALELVSSSAPGEIRITSVAGAVGLSPDYLGRLCKQQTGLSFSATTRWVRLLAGLRYLAGGGSVTDAAHLAGFADGSHANRACWEMASERFRAGAHRFAGSLTAGRVTGGSGCQRCVPLVRMSVVAQHSLPAAPVLAGTNATDLYKQPRPQSLHAYLVIHGAAVRSTCPDAAPGERPDPRHRIGVLEGDVVAHHPHHGLTRSAGHTETHQRMRRPPRRAKC